VPLSEHEQRQLEQIEQALYADHPRLARAMRAKDPKVHYRRRLVQASLGFVIGVGALVAGVVLRHSWLDGVGFVLMVASSIWAIANYRRMSGVMLERGSSRGRGRDGRSRDGRGRDGRSRDSRGRDRRDRDAPDRRGPKPANSGMMDRIEERWRRRQERDR
jgi:hypothetical protein